MRFGDQAVEIIRVVLAICYLAGACLQLFVLAAPEMAASAVGFYQTGNHSHFQAGDPTEKMKTVDISQLLMG